MLFITHSVQKRVSEQPQHRRRQAPKFNFASEIYALFWFAPRRVESLCKAGADWPPKCTVIQFGAVVSLMAVQKRISHRFCIHGFAVVFGPFLTDVGEKGKTVRAF